MAPAPTAKRTKQTNRTKKKKPSGAAGSSVAGSGAASVYNFQRDVIQNRDLDIVSPAAFPCRLTEEGSFRFEVCIIIIIKTRSSLRSLLTFLQIPGGRGLYVNTAQIALSAGFQVVRATGENVGPEDIFTVVPDLLRSFIRRVAIFQNGRGLFDINEYSILNHGRSGMTRGFADITSLNSLLNSSHQLGTAGGTAASTVQVDVWTRSGHNTAHPIRLGRTRLSCWGSGRQQSECVA